MIRGCTHTLKTWLDFESVIFLALLHPHQRCDRDLMNGHEVQNFPHFVHVVAIQNHGPTRVFLGRAHEADVDRVLKRLDETTLGHGFVWSLVEH